MFYTADRETGTFIDEFLSVDKALEAIEMYEAQDRREGIYIYNFYDVVDSEHCTVIDK